MLQHNQATQILTGAEIFLKSLEAEGIKHIFGIPGGVILPIYDALYKQNAIQHILTKHEQAAVHAAEGYARSTGKVGVALATSGPGATNTITGITDAYYDSVPIVVFTGNVALSMLGDDAFQESDIVCMTRACTKHNYIVRDIHELATTIKEAFYIARTGRPGPVLVDLPKDISISSCPFHYPESVNLRGYNPSPEINEDKILAILEEIKKSQKPLILCGGGIVSSNSSTELTQLSEKFDIPVVSTLMGLSGFPAKHKNFLGFSGMHGNYWSNMALSECDLLLVLGSRFSDRQTGVVSQYAPNAEIIHIDIDPTQLNKNVPAHTAILADIKEALTLLLENSKSYNPEDQKKPEWWNQIGLFREEAKTLQNSANKSKLRPSEVIKKVFELSNDDAIITTEVGQHQMWSAQHFNKDYPRTFISSGGLGTMGFGFPSALGAQLANPGRQVIAIAGDGSIQMNIQELATAVAYNLPVKVIIINNGYLGMVRQWQGILYERRYSQTKLFSPDYEKFAEAYGTRGFRIETREDLEYKLKEALSYDGPTLIDCIVEEEDDVYPFVPVGKANKDMLMEAK